MRGELEAVGPLPGAIHGAHPDDAEPVEGRDQGDHDEHAGGERRLLGMLDVQRQVLEDVLLQEPGDAAASDASTAPAARRALTARP